MKSEEAKKAAKKTEIASIEAYKKTHAQKLIEASQLSAVTYYYVQIGYVLVGITIFYQHVLIASVGSRLSLI